VHDLALAHREHEEQLAVELHAGEFLAGVVADAEHGVVSVGEHLERVHLRRLLARGTEPTEHLPAPFAGDAPLTSVQTKSGWKRSAIDSTSRRRSASIRSSTICRLACACSWFIVSSFWLHEPNGTESVQCAGRCARTTTEPLRARAQPQRRSAREEEDLRGGGPRSTSDSLWSARH
jgi:hypothetical protein